MKRVKQKCGWCKQSIHHQVMTMESCTTGVVDTERCELCGASLVPFETPDGVARISAEGDPAKREGEPCWSQLRAGR